MNKITHIILVIIMFGTHSWLNAQNPVIIYIGDPMCSWCYGIAPELEKLQEALPNHEFKVVLGGLRPGATETNAELSGFLRSHWKEVAERTGQPFNYGILEMEGVIYDTEPACRAVVAARMLGVEDEFAYFKAVQRSFYVDNLNPNVLESHVQVAMEQGLDSAAFVNTFESEACKKTTREDFQLAAQMGVRGFPTLVVRHEGQLYMIANGYTTAEEMLKIMARIQEGK